MSEQNKGRVCPWRGVRAVLAALAMFAFALGISLAAPAPAQAAETHTVTLVTFDPNIGGSWYYKFPDGSYKKTITVADGEAIPFGKSGFNDQYTPKDTSGEDRTFVHWNKLDLKNKKTSVWYADMKVTEDMTLIALFSGSSDEVRVDFMYPEASDYPDTTLFVKYTSAGNTVSKPADPVREGYDFKGWYADSRCTEKFDFNTKVEKSTRVWAKFEKKTYTVTFDTNMDSSEQIPVKVAYGDAVSAPDKPTTIGYDFVGWYTDKDGTTAYDFNTPVTGNMTLYAKWHIREFTVTFDTNGGSEIATQKVEYGRRVQKPAQPTWKDSSKVFSYWYTPVEGYPDGALYDFTQRVTRDMTICVAWANAVTITFDSNGGDSTPAAVTIARNRRLTELPTVTKTDPDGTKYKLDGWWISNDTEATTETYFRESVTLTAHWSTDTSYHGVTYYDGSYVVRSDAVADGGKAEELTFQSRIGDDDKTSYAFGGWYADADFKTKFDFNTAIKQDVNLYAKWIPETRHVTYYANGGKFDDASTQRGENVDYDACAAMAAVPTCAGYTFAGWYTAEGDDGYEFDLADTPITKDLELYAHWTRQTFQVTFDSQGGSSVDSPTISYGDPVAEPEEPTREGYTFAGWYTKAEGGDKWRFSDSAAGNPDTVTSELTLYAHWTEDTYTVSFDLNGGTSKKIADQSVKYGKTVIEPKDPTKENDGFYAWFTADNVKWDFDNDVVTSDMTLHAEWVEGGDDGLVGHLVCYYVDGEFVGTGFGYEGTTITPPEDDTLAEVLGLADDKAIDGWYLDADLTKRIDFDSYKMGDDDLDIYARVADKSSLMRTVTFHTGIDTTIDPVQVKYGEKISAPSVTLTAKGYTFAGWYTDENCTTKFDFSTPVTEDMTLWAGWLKDGSTTPTNTPDGKEDASGKDSKKGDMPQTGDNALVAICIAGVIGAAALVAGFIVRRGKE